MRQDRSRVFLTGGTGFTGRFVLRRLLGDGYSVTVFARDRNKARALQTSEGELEIAEGNLDDPESYNRAVRGHAILVNTASIGFGHAAAIIEGAQQAGVERAVFFSTTALFTTLDAESKSRRQEAEDLIRTSALAWTILRPTMISGAPGDRNLIRLIQWVDRHRLVPVFGPGTCRMQPVYVQDLADAVVRVLQSSATIRRAYNLSGATVIDYNGMVQLVGRLLYRRPRLVHLPVRLSLLGARMATLLPGMPKLSPEQVLRLNEHKDFDHGEAARDFGYAPTPLAEYLRAEIEAYRCGRAA